VIADNRIWNTAIKTMSREKIGSKIQKKIVNKGASAHTG
jgi:hypothetical protein